MVRARVGQGIFNDRIAYRDDVTHRQPTVFGR